MTGLPPKRPIKLRSVFVSDVHLGCRSASVSYLLDFLKQVDTEYLYLVGDIVDLWSLQRGFFWPQEHNNVLRLILSKAKRGAKVIYIPGNHDEACRDYVGQRFGNLRIQRNAVHTTADGRKLLVLHGDEFDSAIQCAEWLGFIGHHAYELSLGLNRRLNWLRSRLGFPYWSLASYLKHKTQSANQHIERFELAAAHQARWQGLDGVVCGHIHRPKIDRIDGIDYLNCGDWVESCTAITEDHAGHMSLMHWSDRQHLLPGRTTAAVGAALKPRGDAA